MTNFIARLTNSGIEYIRPHYGNCTLVLITEIASLYFVAILINGHHIGKEVHLRATEFEIIECPTDYQKEKAVKALMRMNTQT